MCSVVGCESWRRSAHRFKLPRDPEERLEWVQFLFEINGQRFKESSWTDITICTEHFTSDCFENVSASVQLKSRAVPSLCIKSEPQEPTEPDQEIVKIEVTEDAFQCVQISTHDDPSSCSEESQPTSYAAQRSPEPSDNSDTSMYDYGQMLQRVESIDIIRDKVALLQMKGNYVVNENRLIPLFAHKCPLCGSKVRVEKLTCGVLIILNKQCIQCEYRDQWKSRVNARVPTDEDHHLTGGIHVTPETQQTESADDESSTVRGVLEYVAYDDEQVSDPMDEEEGSASEGDMDSDGNWSPTDEVLLEDDDRSESDDYDDLPKHTQLCADCGMFYSEHRPHTCEHKTKPYSCNICGKRCVSEVALNRHSRVHNENYEHRCKYCHPAFKTKADKHKHERTHLTEEKPYRCADCSQTFSTYKERKIHLEDQQCDKSFNHNLSLKSHVQRFHTGFEQKDIKNRTVMDTVDAQKENNQGTDAAADNVEEEHDKKEEMQKERTKKPETRWRSTGRPIGRPKRNAAGNFEAQSQCSNSKTAKVKMRRLKRTRCSDEENEGQSAESDTPFDSAKERSGKAALRRGRSKGRGRNSKSD